MELREIGQVAVPVTDIERATAFYRDTLGMPDHELWMAFLQDPDGNPVGLMSEVRV